MVLPNVSFAIPVWYLVPPTGKGATHITAIGLKPLSPKENPPIQEIVENILAKENPIAKPMITAKKTERGKMVETPAIQQESPGCAICDVVSHPTHIFPEMDELKPLLGSEAKIATPQSLKKELGTKGKGKALRTNHACIICSNYGHYTHHCPEIPRYKDTLHAIERFYQEDPPTQSVEYERHINLYLQEEQ